MNNPQEINKKLDELASLGRKIHEIRDEIKTANNRKNCIIQEKEAGNITEITFSGRCSVLLKGHVVKILAQLAIEQLENFITNKEKELETLANIYHVA